MMMIQVEIYGGSFLECTEEDNILRVSHTWRDTIIKQGQVE